MAKKLDTTSTVTLVLNGQQSQTSLREVTSAVNSLRTSLGNMRREDNPELYRQRVQELQRMRTAQRELANEINNVTDEQKTFFSEFKKGFGEIGQISAGVTLGNMLASGIQMAAGAVKDFVKSVVETYSTFQKFDAVLTNTLGSSSASAAALKMLSKFAAETPFSMEELVGSFIKLVNRGIKPTTDELRSMGDLAASQGKTFDELTEAVLDAMTGEFERLKEFGIRASKNGDVVKLSFKGVTQEVANTEEAIQKAILGFGAMDGVAGGMQKMSERIGGVISNISDNWDRFLNRVGNSTGGFLFSVVSGFNAIIEVMGDARSTAEQLTDKYNEQKTAVSNLEKNTVPLIDRYDELKSKGQLNKTEQVELKSILAQLADTIPNAIDKWDKYGNALSANTTKAREYIEVQKAVMKFQNKDAIEALISERNVLTRKRLQLTDDLNDGSRADDYSYGSTPGIHKMNDREIQDTRKELRDLVMKTKQIDDVIKGLTGQVMDEVVKPPEKKETVKALADMTIGELETRVGVLNKALKDTVRGSGEYKKIAAEIAEIQKMLNPDKAAKAVDKINHDKKAYADGLAEITARLKEFNQDELADTLSKYDKANAALEKKFDKEKETEQKALNKLKASKYANADEIAAKQDEINKLDTRKSTALAALKTRQEREVGEAIAAFHDKMAGKLATELEKEEAEIKKWYAEQIANAGTNKALVERLEKARDIEIANAGIREEERFQKEKKKLQAEGAVSAADKDKAELARINKKYDDEIAALKSKFSKEFQATKAFQDLLDELEGKRKKDIAARGVKDDGDERKKKIAFAADTAHTIASASFEIGRNNRQRQVDFDLDKIDKQREAELSKKNLTEKQKAAINEKYDKEAAAIKRKQWEADKAAALQMAYIQAALGMIKAIPNWYEVAAAGFAGAANIAIISNTKAPKFGKGGQILGPSHDAGGIPLINGNTGQQIAEVEGDETLAVFSKTTSRNNRMLINELLYNGQYRNGAPVKVNSEMAIKATPQYFATGGLMSMTGTDTQFTSNSTATGGNNDMAMISAGLMELNKSFAAWSKKPWEFPMRAFNEEQEKIDRIKNRANPK